MARQIQFRRGSAAEHDNFIGAVGEITVDTTNWTLHVHDGRRPGGVVLARAKDAPSDIITQTWYASDGRAWYRKYKSGWIEQGGTSAVAAVRFPIAFSTTNYTISAIAEMISSDVGTISICYTNKTVDGIDIQVRWNGAGADTVSRMWFACGF